MHCAWDAFIKLLPIRMRYEVDKLGKDVLQEVRLRLGYPPELVTQKKSIYLDQLVDEDDLTNCIHFATQYSPWTAESVGQGYITAPGGHRIGVFGRFVQQHACDWSMQTPSMLCLRVARDFPGISAHAAESANSILIIGAPGTGKTTLLRDLIRQYSNSSRGNVSVIDEKEEIFPQYKGRYCFLPGIHTDVLSGCKKSVGIEWALRNMTPSVIAVDEITAQSDCDAILHAGWCGVRLFATAHAGSKEDLFTRSVYKPIIEHNLFQTLLIMQSDKNWHAERMTT